MDNTPRYSIVNLAKETGETYTPAGLADFVAERLIACKLNSEKKVLKILDPAVGDGVLLISLLRRLKDYSVDLDIVAYDTNSVSIKKAKKNISKSFPKVQVSFRHEDFLLQYDKPSHHTDFFKEQEDKEKFDLIIANPPYVRTQILGAEKAREIALKFNLKGRIDLFQPFLIAMTDSLTAGGSIGAIVSNRFLTTQAGASIRSYLNDHLKLDELWDLGDTKLFEAAVLPALIFASKSDRGVTNPKFTSIYESEEGVSDVTCDIFSALKNNKISRFRASNGKMYTIKRGVLGQISGSSNKPWAVSTVQNIEWLASINANTECTFGDISKIRVGVKSTADKVFLKKDWSDLVNRKPELLHPLITRKNATRYGLNTELSESSTREILYPYDMSSSVRKVVKLDDYPNMKAYLLSHKKALSSRKYLIEAGRKWYEIWVPHSPSGWKERKIVFPDISEKPMFWIDDSGSIVSGECYWLVLNKEENPDLLYLILAIANSKFIEEFYDMSFPNKLYSGKRRFITQYVKNFPIPFESKYSRKVVELVKELLDTADLLKRGKLEQKLDKLVNKCFGV